MSTPNDNKRHVPSNSWIIRNKATGEVIMETFDAKKVAALNTKKYEAILASDYLGSLNKALSEIGENKLRQGDAIWMRDTAQAALTATQPSPAAIEQALAEAKANQEKIGATVQAARASATQPQPIASYTTSERAKSLMAENDGYDSLLQAAQRGGATVALEIVKLIRNMDALQAQRDELLAAAKAWDTGSRWPIGHEKRIAGASALRAAIARATEGAKQ